MIQKYLNQQKLLFGEELYIDKNRYIYDYRRLNKNIGVCNGQLDKNLTAKCRICHSDIVKEKIVYGSGNLNPEILIIMESPEKNDVLQGKLLFGNPGKLLNKILIAIKRKRDEDIYLTSLLKFRHKGNREPLYSEVKNCIEHLTEKIEFLNPKLILLFGKVVAKILLEEIGSIDDFRQKIFMYQNKPTIVTYHPISLIRNEKLKNLAWKDFKFIKSFLDN